MQVLAESEAVGQAADASKRYGNFASDFHQQKATLCAELLAQNPVTALFYSKKDSRWWQEGYVECVQRLARYLTASAPFGSGSGVNV